MIWDGIKKSISNVFGFEKEQNQEMLRNVYRGRYVKSDGTERDVVFLPLKEMKNRGILPKNVNYKESDERIGLVLVWDFEKDNVRALREKNISNKQEIEQDLSRFLNKYSFSSNR